MDGKETHHQHRNTIGILRHARCAAGCAFLVCFGGGCFGGGLLIQPVSAKRELVETNLSPDVRSRHKIALIDVSGLIMNAPEWRFIGEGEQPVSLLLEQLDKAADDPAVKAVILRINSPGGTVVASELMHDEIMHFRKRGKPVIASMMDVAASGGYYVACACDEIVAHPSTVTGSIGVLMQTFDVSGTMSMIGVRGDAITSGPNKDAGSPFRAMEPDERRLFQSMIDEMYAKFVEVVDAGRPKLDEAAVRKLADGRVYTAGQALEVGLIDRIATMRETVELAEKRAGVGRARLVTYHRPLEYKPNYYAAAPAGSPTTTNLFNLDVGAALTHTTPRFMYLWQP